MVPQGSYQARLTIGDWSDTRSFAARMDPRVIEEGITPADVTAQVDLSLQVRDALSTARLAAAHLEKAIEEQTENVDPRLTELLRELLTAPIRYSQPMLVDQLQYLYGNLDSADQRPGRDARERYAELKAALEIHIQSLERLLGTRLQE